jgi:hypothetical protein
MGLGQAAVSDAGTGKQSGSGFFAIANWGTGLARADAGARGEGQGAKLNFKTEVGNDGTTSCHRISASVV